MGPSCHYNQILNFASSTVSALCGLAEVMLAVLSHTPTVSVRTSRTSGMALPPLVFALAYGRTFTPLLRRAPLRRRFAGRAVTLNSGMEVAACM